jgi:quercetin dioxygenase-like cupin family protein
MDQGAGYRIKAIEPVMMGRDVQARLFTLAPGEAIPWHFHSTVTDWYFVLQGTLSIETRAPPDRRLLPIGASHQILPKTAHRISNPTAADTRFLLLQGVGAYDFVTVGGEPAPGSRTV